MSTDSVGAAGAACDADVTDVGPRDAVDVGRLDRDAAERVLRRAVQLDDDVAGEDHRVSVQALVEAAAELGIDGVDVRRAVVEERLGMLSTRRRPADALAGPECFVVARVLDGDPGAVLDRVDEWMRRGRVLRRSRSPQGVDGAPGWVEYSRRNDPIAGAQRAVRAFQGHGRLAHVRRVRVLVGRVDRRRCVVGLIVDGSRSRRAAVAGAAATTLGGAAVSVDMVVALGHPWPLAVGGVALSAFAGVGVMWTRRIWTDGVDGDLEALLDAVESGERPRSAIDGVASRLARGGR